MKFRKITTIIIFFITLSSGLFALERNAIEKDISIKINQAPPDRARTVLFRTNTGLGLREYSSVSLL
ncbi:MAG: hypothetical protein P8Y35_02855 [Sulfurovaceae bacterium]